MPPLDTSKEELAVLRNHLDEAHLILSTIQLPQGRAQRAAELIDASLAITDDLLKRKPAAELGSKGGLRTAERGRILLMKEANSGNLYLDS